MSENLSLLSVEHTYLSIKGRQVPARIYREFRRSVRASIGKRAAILRMPRLLTKAQQRQQMEWFTEWVAQQMEKNSHLEDRFFGKNYQSGDILQVGERSYLLQIDYADRKTHSGKIRNRVLHLRLSQHDPQAHLSKSIKHLLSRLVAQDYLPEITRRVNELNALYFQKNIKSVNLKYNHSNWGSCSAKGNVNLSTRLLFAPADVIDYVIIHELAHLIEMNHSNRFWRLVADAMPDYKAKERWLKEYGASCDF
ncbi:MAG: M48 family metallopeptidase [Bacteroidota bacterium]